MNNGPHDKKPDEYPVESLHDAVKRLCAESGGFIIDRTDEAVEKGMAYILTGAPGPGRGKKVERKRPLTDTSDP